MVLFTKLLTTKKMKTAYYAILSMVLFTKLLTGGRKFEHSPMILSMVLFTKLLTREQSKDELSGF